MNGQPILVAFDLNPHRRAFPHSQQVPNLPLSQARVFQKKAARYRSQRRVASPLPKRPHIDPQPLGHRFQYLAGFKRRPLPAIGHILRTSPPRHRALLPAPHLHRVQMHIPGKESDQLVKITDITSSWSPLEYYPAVNPGENPRKAGKECRPARNARSHDKGRCVDTWDSPPQKP